MFKLVTAATGFAVVLILAGCSIAPPSGSATGGELDAATAADSLHDASYDEMFLDLYGEIVRKLDAYTEDEKENIVLIEVQSVVTIAEEIYLEGNVELAVNLLREAALLLRQTP
jgi:hypothetical protein